MTTPVGHVSADVVVAVRVAVVVFVFVFVFLVAVVLVLRLRQYPGRVEHSVSPGQPVEVSLRLALEVEEMSYIQVPRHFFIPGLQHETPPLVLHCVFGGQMPVPQQVAPGSAQNLPPHVLADDGQHCFPPLRQLLFVGQQSGGIAEHYAISTNRLLGLLEAAHAFGIRGTACCRRTLHRERTFLRLAGFEG